MKPTQSELDAMLKLHRQWIANPAEGKKLDLVGANLRGANLSEADLSEANLRGANLTWANLTGADLSEVDLSGADLRGAIFCGACLDGVILAQDDLKGPGHILYALTDEEALWVKQHREKPN